MQGSIGATMPIRLLHYRFAFAAVAMIALLAAAWFENIWLAGPGVAAAFIGECLGLAQIRARHEAPIERSLRNGAEALPAIGVAAFEPWAIGVTVAIVLFALMANGMLTVARSRGVKPERQPGETLRRGLTALACLLLLPIPIAATTTLRLGDFGVDAHSLAIVATAVAMLAGLRCLTDMALSARRV